MLSTNKIELVSMPTTLTPETTRSNPDIPKPWEKASDSFTSNDVIDAFFKGKKAGKEELQAVFMNQFKENLKAAIRASETLSAYVEKQLKTEIRSIHIRPEDITNFCALFVVSKESQFLSDKFKNAYIKAREVRNKTNRDYFKIDFLFTPNTKHLNDKCLSADGFLFKNDKSRSPKTRKTQ